MDNNLNRDHLLALARELVDASPAAETEVIVSSQRDLFARFAGSGPTQSADRIVPCVRVRVRLAREGGLSEAQAVCDSLDMVAAKSALDRALALAEHGAVSADLVPMGDLSSAEHLSAAL